MGAFLAALPFLAQGAAGLAQSIFGGGKAKKYQRQLENMQSPTYNQNQSILDYYNKALDRYNVSPTDTSLYKQQMRDINRGVATGINSLQDRRSGLGGISSILRASNDAKLNANVAAEQQREQRFGQLGTATGMKANEDDKAFQYNQMMPFERKFNLLGMKAGAANQTFNSGLNNIFGALQNWGNYNTAKKQGQP